MPLLPPSTYEGRSELGDLIARKRKENFYRQQDVAEELTRLGFPTNTAAIQGTETNRNYRVNWELVEAITALPWFVDKDGRRYDHERLRLIAAGQESSL